MEVQKREPKLHHTISGIPEPAKGILAGIALKLAELGDLHMGFLVDGRPEVYSFRLWRKKVEIIAVCLRGNLISASYSWNGQEIERGAPPPGRRWVNPVMRVNGSGSFCADLMNPHQFESWMKSCEDHIKARVKQLVLKQAMRDIKRMQGMIALEAWRIKQDARKILGR